MPEIIIHSRSSDAGDHFLNFSIDGKRYVATPKKDKPGDPKAWLDEFEELLKFSKKYRLNPFATPLKSDPIKADKYKKRRMFDRVKYSWNDDESLKEGTRKGLNYYIDVVRKEKLDEHLVEKYSPEVEQMKLKLSRYNLKKEAYMKSSYDQEDISKNSTHGAEHLEKHPFIPGRSSLHTPQTLEEMRSPVTEIINPHMTKIPKQIPEHSDIDIKKIKDPHMLQTKKACIEKLNKLANYLESKGHIQEAYEIDKISDKIETYKNAYEQEEEFGISEFNYNKILDALTKKFGKVGTVSPEPDQYGHTWKNGIALRKIHNDITLYIPKNILKDPFFKTLPMSHKKEKILY